MGAFAGNRSSAYRLATRDPSYIGNLHLDPASRAVIGPSGRAIVEPRIMQVLLALVDHAGRVVTRETLIELCWDGQIVGDDAINRAISGARRAMREAGGDIEIETIPKAGYRLNTPPDLPATAPLQAEPPGFPRRVDRRTLLIGGGVVAFGAVAGIVSLQRRDPRVTGLIARAREALREDLPDSSEQGIGFLREAVALAPKDALAWGLLSLALVNVAEYAPLDQVGKAVAACERAARTSLSIDPRQPDALAALVLIRPTYGDWPASERRLRGLALVAPRHAPTLAALGMLMQSVGRCREAAGITERAIALEPLSPTFQYRLAYQLWSSGNARRADQVIERAVQLWPGHPAVWYARMLILGLTGRPAAALAMFGDTARPRTMPPRAFAPWRMTLQALVSSDADMKKAATRLNLELAQQGSSGAVNAILALNALAEPAQALAVTEGYLLRRGRYAVPMGYVGDQLVVNNQRWKKTMMLFVPATGPMRRLPAFEGLVTEMGLVAYWREAGITPDYLMRAGRRTG